MTEQWLWIAASCIYILLSSLHLLYTFFTNKFSVRDVAVEERMKKTWPVLTRKTTMWKAWIGFNASHSAGGIFLGGINLYLVTCHFTFLEHSIFLLLFTCMTSFFYLFLGFKYWFSIPRNGILIATVCFTIATVLIIMK
ncbi:MAG TPA: hypothetical protein VGO58_12715 [Chitinophagaceae bacterium]|jgi:hypothetical protein|nr:hypothetical protein [Chitinophagaceae bacterium]